MNTAHEIIIAGSPQHKLEHRGAVMLVHVHRRLPETRT